MSMTSGTQVRDFCSVDDIARAVLMVIERKSENLIEKFNLGSGRSLPLRELVTEVCSDLGIRPELRFGETSMHPYEPHHSVADITSARKTLGWAPRHRLSHAVWELARQTHPNLVCNEPERNAQFL
jgi:nucleoside-diphosphate-sugar epimerase